MLTRKEYGTAQSRLVFGTPSRQKAVGGRRSAAHGESIHLIVAVSCWLPLSAFRGRLLQALSLTGFQSFHDADFFEIVPEQLYTAADLDWRDKTSRSTIEMQDKSSRPAIKGRCENIADYDTVWIGFPVWWYTAPTIVNTFIEAHDLSGKTLNVFATSGGSGVEGSANDLKNAYPQYTWGESRLMN